MNIVAISSVLAVALFTSATAFAAQAQAPQGDAGRGKAAFLRAGCYTCHGYEGQGAPATGKKLAPGPLPYPVFSNFVRTTSGQMPPFTVASLPEQDLADIHAYLRTFPATPNQGTIPLLQDIGR